MARNKYLDNALIINVECVALRYGVLAATNNGYSNLEIEGNSKVITDGYNIKSSLSNSINLLIEGIWTLAQLSKYLPHIYRETTEQ